MVLRYMMLLLLPRQKLWYETMTMEVMLNGFVLFFVVFSLDGSLLSCRRLYFIFAFFAGAVLNPPLLCSSTMNLKANPKNDSQLRFERRD